MTLGATYGFHVPITPGEWSVRGEWMHQWGNGRSAHPPGEQASIDQFPPYETGTLLIGYSIGF